MCLTVKELKGLVLTEIDGEKVLVEIHYPRRWDIYLQEAKVCLTSFHQTLH